MTALVALLAVGALLGGGSARASDASFQASCPFSHRANDDPILHPRMPGMAHSHEFFGNRTTNARTTLRALRTGSTTCTPRDDRSAYWVPTLWDGGRIVPAEQATFYYARGPRTARRKVRAFPQGLRVIAGDMTATGPQKPAVALWSCQGTSVRPSPTMVRCPLGAPLELDLRFPECWNGRDLDSGSHKRHMAYARSGRCPRTHPVLVPQLTFRITYLTQGGSPVKLSSGPGYTAHGDFFNAWSPAALDRRVRSCLRAARACGTSTRAAR